MYDDQELYESYGRENDPEVRQEAYGPAYPQDQYQNQYQDQFQYQSNEDFRETTSSHPVADRWPGQPEIISTSQAINLTCSLASISVLFALFLCFADQRSRAVRRFAIQSVGFGAIHIGVGVVCWLVDMLLGWVPYLGYWLHLMLSVVMIAVSILFVAIRVVMMFHAYRGEAYSLPVFGESLRRFE